VDYPLNLSFKILAMAPQISVTDSHGKCVFYVKQKLMKLKESVTVFTDAKQTEPLYFLNADQVIDFSARYHFTDTDGTTIGAVQRRGMKSLWRAHYDILDGNRTVLQIREVNPWVKVADTLLGEIPILGIFTGYLFHPAYVVTRAGDIPVMRLEKQASLLEKKFTITRQQTDLAPHEETRVLLSLLMMVLLERRRG